MVRGPGIQGRCSSRRGWRFSQQTASTRSSTIVGGDNAKVAIALGAIPLPSDPPITMDYFRESQCRRIVAADDDDDDDDDTKEEEEKEEEKEEKEEEEEDQRRIRRMITTKGSLVRGNDVTKISCECYIIRTITYDP
ncbi:hypothetical protein HZH66_006412 [Vespula vulgaris]|uniref:Uncharacterized protein n=1 Tax=Vespula vulgaris TaxID=7454 RepID=A0A834K282_VESVU|nr:hypothetical protein HZH66_006412 [Vespula vulgaris]